MQGIFETDRRGIAAVIDRVTTLWALLGGLMVLLVVGLNLSSVVGAVFGHPLPGDFELTQMGIAVSIFAFLPYCQMHDANVTADIFTSGAGVRTVAVLKTLAALVATLFAGLLLWRMYLGMIDQRDYDYTTTILQWKIWWAYAPSLVSLMLLVLAALVTLAESLRVAGGRHE